MSVLWSAVSGVGMAAAMDESVRQRMHALAILMTLASAMLVGANDSDSVWGDVGLT